MTNQKQMVIKDCNPIFKKEGLKGWPAGLDDSAIVLELGCYYSNINDILKRSDFSSKLEKNVKNWSLSDLVCSALWYAFEKKQLSVYSWSIFFTFLMHRNCTYSVLFFLEFNYIDKSFLRKDILNGLIFALENSTFLYVDVDCIKNILIFLEIEIDVIDKISLDILNQQNWKIIIKFLKKNQSQILIKRNLWILNEIVRQKQNDPNFANYSLLYKEEAKQKAEFWKKIQNSQVWAFSKLIFMAFFACKLFPRISKDPSLVTNAQPLAAEIRIIELVELGRFSQGASIGRVVFPRPMHIRRASTVPPVALNQEFGLQNETLAVEGEMVESKTSSDCESLDSDKTSNELESSLSDTGSLLPENQEDLKFENLGISGDSSFRSEKESLKASSSTDEYLIFNDDLEEGLKMISDYNKQKQMTSEKGQNPFRTRNKLKRTISGFAPTNELNRTQSEGIHGFFSTTELSRTNPKISQGEVATSQATEMGNTDLFENTTDSFLDNKNESFITKNIFQKKNNKLSKKIRKLTKREKLDVQIEHGFNNKLLAEKASQRVVYLKKSTLKNPDNILESNPGVKLKVNQGDHSCLNMDTSIIPYHKSKMAADHFKDRIEHLPRTESEKNEVYKLDPGENDHSIGKNAHQNFSTDYDTAKTMTVSKSNHNDLTSDRVKVEKDGNFEMSRSVVEKLSPQDLSDIRQFRDKQTFQNISDVEFEKRGTTREAYQKSSQEIHQSDRTSFGKAQIRLQLTATEHTLYGHVRNLAYGDNQQCNRAILAIEPVPIRYLDKEKVIQELLPFLDSLQYSNKFAVGIRDNQPAHSPLANSIDEALILSSNGKRVLFKVLRDKGLAVEEFHKYNVPESSNLALETPDKVPYKEKDFFLYQSSLRTGGLYSSELDYLGEKLQVNRVDSGRKSVISPRPNYRKPNSQRSKSF